MHMERTTIWYPGDGYEFAAKELAEYAEKITGRKAALTDQDGMPAEADRLFVIGSPGTKTLAPFAGSMEKRQTTKQLGSPQSFAIWTEIAEGRKCILLAGHDTVASLYAVYTYLEELCHVGFFQDGEYLPEQPLPFPEKLKTYKPSFIHRKAPFNVWGGHLGIKKFHTRFWNLDEIKRDLRWMAKRHLNHMVATIGIYNGITCELAREVCEELGYPIDPIKEEEVYVSGFPVSWMWPPSYRVEMMREAFAYARTLGIKVIYGIRTGEVPMDFKKKYPQFTYVKEAELWEYAQLHPDDPFFEEFSSRYLRRIIETFGTDHLYCGLPYGETSPESNPEENFQLKSKGAMSFIKLLKAVDPKAIWVTDSWDIFWSPDTWTRKNVKTYLEKMPHDSFFIYDTNADNRGVPAFQEHNHFHGRKWAFGVMHSAAGHEQPHGDFHDLLKRVSDAVSRKDNNQCEGMFLVPELTHYDMFYYDFLTGVTWNSVPFDLDGFFDDFVLRRYGVQPSSPMRRYLDCIIQALYTREMNIPFYRHNSMRWIWHNCAPSIQRFKIPILYRGLTIALGERDKHQDNPLYTEDMIKMSLALLAELCAYHFHRIHIAYAEDNTEEYDKHVQNCLLTIEWIAKMLSTRKDYSLAPMIEEVMKVPGTNRFTPDMIMHGVVNWGYCSNSSYEQVANLYLPRMVDYLEKLRRIRAMPKPPINLHEMLPDLSPTEKEWKTSGKSLQRAITYEGATLDAIIDSIAACTKLVPEGIVAGEHPRPGRRPRWKISLEESGSWHAEPEGVLIKGSHLESDPALAPLGLNMHKEMVEVPLWGSVKTSDESGFSSVKITESSTLTIRYRIEETEEPLQLFVSYRGFADEDRRIRIWRSFGSPKKWTVETIDLYEAITCHAEAIKDLLSLEIGLLAPPHKVGVDFIEIAD